MAGVCHSGDMRREFRSEVTVIGWGSETLVRIEVDGRLRGGFRRNVAGWATFVVNDLVVSYSDVVIDEI